MRHHPHHPTPPRPRPGLLSLPRSCRVRAWVLVVTGGFPRGKTAGHNFDLVKAKLTNWLLDLGLVTYTTTSSDFFDVQRWLPDCHFLITYVAGPVPEEGDNTYIQDWLSSGGRWLAIHGTSGGKADRTPGAVGMVKMVGPPPASASRFCPALR